MKKRMLRAAADIIAAAALFCMLIPVCAMPTVSARHAILMDCDTGRVLYEHNANEPALIASTTKIMTALVVLDHCDLRAEVQIPEEATCVEGSSIYLQKNEVLLVEDLLYGLMLQSGNDAAVALAIYCAGSEEAFVEKMNAKASALGLDQTHFVNPHGLDDKDHFSCAKDLAVLTRCALENEDFLRIVSAKEYRAGNRVFRNHNKMLWQYPGAIGVKTGYTKAAGRILVSSAEKNGRRLIAVTINDPDDWNDHKQLLNYGFEHFQSKVLFNAGEIIGSVDVIGGAEPFVDVCVREKVEIPAATGERIEICCDLPPFIYAPILAGEEAGRFRVLIDGCEIISVPVYWRYSVLEDG